MRFGIVVFPGSNCDHDTYHVVKHVLGQDAEFLWHGERDLRKSDCVILPGGFAHGDYLRCGALARFSPIMQEVAAFAKKGGPVLGICNGFQVLTEAGTLDGALLRNASLRFICKQVHIRVEKTDTPFTGLMKPGQVLKIPIAHMVGNYYADAETLKKLEGDGRIIFRYCSPKGEVDPDWNPNGSMGSIAGICNRARNVVALMPHPERASEPEVGSEDGLDVFKSVISTFEEVIAGGHS
ncbi:MAG: phosphoribosylformylglycinamidine synthase subunit PurQ [Acidobacteriota bacterium]